MQLQYSNSVQTMNSWSRNFMQYFWDPTIFAWLWFKSCIQLLLLRDFTWNEYSFNHFSALESQMSEKSDMRSEGDITDGPRYSFRLHDQNWKTNKVTWDNKTHFIDSWFKAINIAHKTEDLKVVTGGGNTETDLQKLFNKAHNTVKDQ